MNLLTTEEVAEKLKVSKYTVYEMIKRGKIQALRIGRVYRITENDLDEYLKSCLTAAKEGEQNERTGN